MERFGDFSNCHFPSVVKAKTEVAYDWDGA
jgi:hypothetical protein